MSKKPKKRMREKAERQRSANSYVKEKTNQHQPKPPKALPPPPKPVAEAKTPVKLVQPAKPTFTSVYNQIPVLKTKFNPEIHPIIFAQICTYFCREQPSETAGYFNWDEETNMIDWCWSDPTDNKQSGSSVESGSALARIAWLESGETGRPNGQWHTHPSLTVYWSPTDKESQLRYCVEMVPHEKKGFFCFVVLDQLDWLATKIIWEDGQIIVLENGKVHLNGVPLNGVKKPVVTYNWHNGNYGTYDYANYTQQTWGTPHNKKEDAPKLELAQEEIDELFKGDNPKEDVYYKDLFSTFFVAFYDWMDLYEAIESAYPGQYEDIINEKVSWLWLRNDYDSKTFYTM